MPRARILARRVDLPVAIPKFDAFETIDRFERTITFYLSRPKEDSARLPLVAFIQGSGCHSLFRQDKDSRIQGGYQTILLSMAKARLRVLAVEKPGVRLFDNPGPDGTAERCSKAFLEEHTLERWAEAVSASMRAAGALPDIEPRRVLLIGHSEGGLTAARVAAENDHVSHVALLSSTGPTQLFDLVERAKHSHGKETGNTEDRVRNVYHTLEKIRRDPDSTSKFAWGHPYRRWSSFISSSTLDELLRSRARIYIAHGSHDTKVPVAAFELLCAELARHGRDFVATRVEGAGHNLGRRDQEGPVGMAEIFSDIVNWFLRPPKTTARTRANKAHS